LLTADSYWGHNYSFVIDLLNSLMALYALKVKVHFVIYMANRKANTRMYATLFYFAVLTPQNYHWYAAARFAFPER